MTHKYTIEQIGTLIDEQGFAAATLAVLGDDISKLVAYADLCASERYEDRENDRVMYIFPDETCIMVYSGEHAEIG